MADDFAEMLLGEQPGRSNPIAVDEVIGAVGRQTIETILTLSATEDACCRAIQQPFRPSTVMDRALSAREMPKAPHVVYACDDCGWPMLGFIFMVDAFRPENGATRFLPGS